jgi:hypothetical protein
VPFGCSAALSTAGFSMDERTRAGAATRVGSELMLSGGGLANALRCSVMLLVAVAPQVRPAGGQRRWARREAATRECGRAMGRVREMEWRSQTVVRKEVHEPERDRGRGRGC